MTGADLCALSAQQAHAEIVAGRVSPLDLTAAVLERIGAMNGAFNCFITVCAEEALAAARAAEHRLARGHTPRPLEGLPLAVKDLVNTAQVRTTFGSVLHADNVPEQDAAAVARLRAAGAILVGKTTTPEFGHKAFTDAPLFGSTANAWHADYTAGGSSGGAAVAMAAGMGPLGIATDGGGSTRIPAACNGVVGLKQTAGVVAHSQTPDPFGNYTYVTPMTRTVADTRMMMAAMAGTDSRDPWSFAPLQDFRGALNDDLRGCRVGLVERLGNELVAQEVLDGLARAGHLMEQAGASVEPLQLELEPIEPIWRVINHSTWRARFGALVSAHGERMTPTLVGQVEMAESFSAEQFQHAAFARGTLFRQVQRWFDRCDVLLMPTLSRTALPISQNLFDAVDIDGDSLPEVRAAWFPYTMPFNLTGHPAVSLPVVSGAHGLPICVQLVGRLHQDARLLDVADALEREASWVGAIADPAIRAGGE